MKYCLEVEFEMDEFTDEGALIEDLRDEIREVIANYSLTENAKVKISEGK